MADLDFECGYNHNRDTLKNIGKGFNAEKIWKEKAHQLAKLVYDLEVQKAQLTYKLQNTACIPAPTNGLQAHAQSSPERIKAKLLVDTVPYYGQGLNAFEKDQSEDSNKAVTPHLPLENVFYKQHAYASNGKDQPRVRTRAVESFHVDTSTLRALLRRAEAELIVLREENEVKEKELLRVLAALHSAQTREGQLQRVIASHEAQLNIVHEALSQSHYDMDVVHTEMSMLKSRPRIEEEQLNTALRDLAHCKAENEDLCEKAAMLESLVREKEEVTIELKEKIENLQQYVENMERRQVCTGLQLGTKNNRSRVAFQSILRVVATVRVLVALTSCI